MIRAAAQYADSKGDAPLPLRYAFQAQTYHALPEAGGLRDQPARLLNQMAACYNVYSAWKDYKAAPDKADWQRHNRDRWKIVSEVLKLDKRH